MCGLRYSKSYQCQLACAILTQFYPNAAVPVPPWRTWPPGYLISNTTSSPARHEAIYFTRPRLSGERSFFFFGTSRSAEAEHDTFLPGQLLQRLFHVCTYARTGATRRSGGA